LRRYAFSATLYKGNRTFIEAKGRKESRGGHFRADAEKKSDEWAKKNIVLKKGGDGSMQISTVPIPEMPAELKAVIEGEMK